jgi:hypothetical protein
VSSIAWFYRIPRADLDGEGGLAEALHQATDVDIDYGWSGYVMLDLLTAVEETGISFGADLPDELDSGELLVFCLTPSDLGAIERLDVSQLDEELFDDLDMDGEELREALDESVAALRQLLVGTTPDEVPVVRIG